MKKILLFLPALILVGAACANTPAPATQRNPKSVPTAQDMQGDITSFTIEPSYEQDHWLMYKDGAHAVVRGKNLQQVEIRYWSTGSGIGLEYPQGELLGQASRADGQSDMWVLAMPPRVMATNFWVQAVDRAGKPLKGPDLGSIGYEESATTTRR